jgi:flagella basal body P-ring formation protein FlgA
MMWRLVLLCLLGLPASAETLVATRNIRAQSVISPDDIGVVNRSTPGALTAAEQALGREARVTLYAGRPIHPGDLGTPAIVDRNQIVPLAFHSGPLAILTEGRALARAGVGDTIRVMNLASRTTVTGRVTADGTVVVGP